MWVGVMIFMYPFLTRALFAGLALSIAGSLLGVPLVLKRYSLMADGLSHTSFAAVIIAMAMGFEPLSLAVPVCIVISTLLLFLEKNHIDSDSLVALVSTASLALGVLVASVHSGINGDVSSFMFGSILAVSTLDLGAAVAIAIAVILFFIIFHNKIFLVTFDESFSKTAGVRVLLYNGAFAVLTSLTIVIAMRLMGALMISAVVLFPALSAMQICKSFRAVLILSVLLGVASFIAALLCACIFNLPVGSLLVLVQLFVLGFCALVSRFRR